MSLFFVDYIFVFSPISMQDDQFKSGTHIYAKSPHLVSENVMEPLQCIFGQAIWGPTNIYAHIFDDIWSAGLDICDEICDGADTSKIHEFRKEKEMRF